MLERLVEARLALVRQPRLVETAAGLMVGERLVARAVVGRSGRRPRPWVQIRRDDPSLRQAWPVRLRARCSGGSSDSGARPSCRHRRPVGPPRLHRCRPRQRHQPAACCQPLGEAAPARRPPASAACRHRRHLRWSRSRTRIGRCPSRPDGGASWSLDGPLPWPRSPSWHPQPLLLRQARSRRTRRDRRTGRRPRLRPGRRRRPPSALGAAAWPCASSPAAPVSWCSVRPRARARSRCTGGDGGSADGPYAVRRTRRSTDRTRRRRGPMGHFRIGRSCVLSGRMREHLKHRPIDEAP